MALPAVVALPTDENAGCFCPGCLAKAVAAGPNRSLVPEARSGEGERQSMDPAAGT
jgi:hypothetical protein